MLIITLTFLTFSTITSQIGFVHSPHSVYAKPGESVRVMTYNIRGARKADGSIQLDKITEDIRQSGADIIALQEVDFRLPRSYFKNQTAEIGSFLLMNYTFKPNINFVIGSYGNAILSKYPIIAVNYYRLPGKSIESRGVLKATINLGYQLIDVYATHLGLDLEERNQQITYIQDLLESNHHPYMILLGDFNTSPSYQQLNNLRGILIDPVFENNIHLPTYFTQSKGYQIDYIMYSPGFIFNEALTMPSSSSDHYPVIYSIEVEQEQVMQASHSD